MGWSEAVGELGVARATSSVPKKRDDSQDLDWGWEVEVEVEVVVFDSTGRKGRKVSMGSSCGMVGPWVVWRARRNRMDKDKMG